MWPLTVMWAIAHAKQAQVRAEERQAEALERIAGAQERIAGWLASCDLATDKKAESAAFDTVMTGGRLPIPIKLGL